MDSPHDARPPDLRLDLTGEVCPMTYVRVRLALDGLAPGASLRVRLAGEAAEQVPRTAAAQGFAVSGIGDEAGDEAGNPDGARWCRISR